MKRIIAGKRYDTETAEMVHSDQYSSLGDFHYWREELYRTKKGAWFIHGEGGPMSGYAVAVGNNTTSGSSNLRPVSAGDARHWLEEHKGDNALEKYFPGQIEDA